MSPFLPEYAEQMNVPICTCFTALTLDSGEVVILEFAQGLWFGNSTEESLIKPNKFRKFGIQICDDPTDPHRKLGIEAPENLFIPMPMEGSTYGLTTHPPTDDDIHECQNILLSDEFDWNLSNNFLKFLQWRRSIGQGQIFIDTSILLRAESHAHL